MKFFLCLVSGIMSQGWGPRPEAVIPELGGLSTIEIDGHMDLENSNGVFPALLAVNSEEVTNYIPYSHFCNIPALLLKNTLRFLIRAGILTKV